MKIVIEEFGGALAYAVAGGGMIGIFCLYITYNNLSFLQNVTG